MAGLTNVYVYAINGLAATGKLNLPSVMTFADSSGWNSPIGQNYYMTEVSLSAESKVLEYVSDHLLYESRSLRRVTFGGVSGFAMKGSGIFDGCNSLQDVIFTGGAPTFDKGVEYVFKDTAEKQLVFAVPRDSAEWQTLLSGNVTLLTRQQQEAFREANPDRPLAHGIVAASVFRTHYPQYIAYSDRAKIIRPGFRMVFR